MPCLVIEGLYRGAGCRLKEEVQEAAASRPTSRKKKKKKGGRDTDEGPVEAPLVRKHWWNYVRVGGKWRMFDLKAAAGVATERFASPWEGAEGGLGEGGDYLQTEMLASHVANQYTMQARGSLFGGAAYHASIAPSPSNFAAARHSLLGGSRAFGTSSSNNEHRLSTLSNISASNLPSIADDKKKESSKEGSKAKESIERELSKIQGEWGTEMFFRKIFSQCYFDCSPRRFLLQHFPQRVRERETERERERERERQRERDRERE